VKKGITGKDGLAALAKANITANKNSVPNDPLPPMVTSGLRIGTPAITTRGFKENEAEQVATWICDILDDINNQKTIDRIQKEALDLCAKFPVYEK
jgi:glycine hydroxymethyltransferase